MSMLPHGEATLLHDGVCRLCHGVVQRVLRRDRSGRFRFTSLRSAMARELLVRHGRDPHEDFDRSAQ